jgi:D-alanine-D-alanine ligase
MGQKLKVGVIFGGKSAEHEVSLVSAAFIIKSMDKNKYHIFPIGITQQGKWLAGDDSLKGLKEGETSGASALPPASLLDMDVVFPVLHGPFGEDGTIQGMFEMLGIPYVGAGVLGCSLAMDKAAAKSIFLQHNLPIVKYLCFNWKELEKSSAEIISKIEEHLGYACFVKPSALGSSIGISKAKNRSGLKDALLLAAKYGMRILVEEAIDAREIECSILGNEEPFASIPGEVIPGGEFYDYFDKYVDGKSGIEIPARLTSAKQEEVKGIAIKAYKAIDCAGLARVDFLLDKHTEKLYLSEINTMPGFTAISMYPKLIEYSGMQAPELIDRLIELALQRHQRKSKLLISFDHGSDWYKKN